MKRVGITHQLAKIFVLTPAMEGLIIVIIDARIIIVIIDARIIIFLDTKFYCTFLYTHTNFKLYT